MLLQLSATVGLNTDAVTDWTVTQGRVRVYFSSKSLLLNTAEGLEFLKHASGDSLLAAANKLTEKETHAELYAS